MVNKKEVLIRGECCPVRDAVSTEGMEDTVSPVTARIRLVFLSRIQRVYV
jgi:hypothetical protein